MPLIFVILDGMSDGGVSSEAPFSPPGCTCMARLAREGGWGALENTPPGMPVDSLTCIATLLGVPAEVIPHGRAYLEALACGIPVGERDAVCRCNLTALGPGEGHLPGGGRLPGEGHLPGETILGALGTVGEARSRELCQALSRDGLELFHLSGYRNLLIIRGGAREAGRLIMHAPHEHIGGDVGSLLPTGGAENGIAGQIRALALESRTVLAGERAMLFPWDIAVMRELPHFSALHRGLSAACVCKTEIVHGLCTAMNIAVVAPQGTTADVDTDVSAKASAALELIRKYDVVLVHVNGADELGHRRDAAGKAAFLRRVDAELLEPLHRGLPKGGRMLICSDHGTSPETGGHVGGPQPLLLYEQGRKPRGALGIRPGIAAVELLAGTETEE